MAATKYHHDNIKRFGIYIIIIEIKLLYILAINIIKTKLSLHKKKFPLRIYSINVTKSAGNCGFGHIC